MNSPLSAAVELERDGPVAWITLNRPDVINTTNEEIRQGVARLLVQLDEETPDSPRAGYRRFSAMRRCTC
jgi:enoyl-CoA hydratase/carnithine racemase